MADQFDQTARDLLVALNQKVSDGFAHISAQLAAMDSRILGTEKRISDLEHWKIATESQAKGFFSAGKIAWGLVVGIAGFAISQGVKFFT